MTYGEANKIIALKMRGDRKDQTITPLIAKEAICDILRYTRPESYVEKTLEDSVYFRKVSSTEHLKMPEITSVNDEDVIPIEEELAMAFVYFVCSYLTVKDSKIYADKGKNICALYDTNIAMIEEEEEII
jgi:hypothetical protein